MFGVWCLVFLMVFLSLFYNEVFVLMVIFIWSIVLFVCFVFVLVLLVCVRVFVVFGIRLGCVLINLMILRV